MLALALKGADIRERKDKLYFLYTFWYPLASYNEYMIVL